MRCLLACFFLFGLTVLTRLVPLSCIILQRMVHINKFSKFARLVFTGNSNSQFHCPVHLNHFLHYHLSHHNYLTILCCQIYHFLLNYYDFHML
ncbi:hypothetical protein C0J52_06499 [Blattella germanica]|nr:hypothetical protein C0J52_06499 [Blattella germanica]